MPILLDIGNTAVKYAFADKSGIKRAGLSLYNDIPKIINNCSKCGGCYSDYLYISSVVPKNTLFIKKNIPRSLREKTLEIGKEITIEITHKYRQINKLGKDRLVNIYGALRLYRPPIMLLDFGTALKVEYLSPRGVFEGGMIIPGPEIAFQALRERGALLPKKMRLPEKSVSFLGTTTYDCMNSGILEGYGAMADGLIARFKEKYGKNITVLVTGGFAKHLKPYTSSFGILDPLHSLKSLFLIYKKSLKN